MYVFATFCLSCLPCIVLVHVFFRSKAYYRYHRRHATNSLRVQYQCRQRKVLIQRQFRKFRKINNCVRFLTCMEVDSLNEKALAARPAKKKADGSAVVAPAAPVRRKKAQNARTDEDTTASAVSSLPTDETKAKKKKAEMAVKTKVDSALSCEQKGVKVTRLQFPEHLAVWDIAMCCERSWKCKAFFLIRALLCFLGDRCGVRRKLKTHPRKLHRLHLARR